MTDTSPWAMYPSFQACGQLKKTSVSILREGKTGKRLNRGDYHVLQTYKLVSFGEIDKAAKKMASIWQVKKLLLNVIDQHYVVSGHAREKKPYCKVAEQYANILRALSAKFIKCCERCIEKHRSKETSSGVVVLPLPAKDLNERGQVDLVNMQTMKDG